MTILLAGCGGGNSTADLPVGSDTTVLIINQLSEDIEREPTNPELYHKRSQLYLAGREFDLALRDINKALSLDDKTQAYYITLADIHLFMAQTDNSLEALNRALRLDPGNRQALLNMARLYLILKNYQGTFQTVNELIRLDDYNPKAYFIRAIAWMEKGDTARAVGDLIKAADQDQQYYDAFVQLGELFSLRTDPLAEGYLRNAIRIRPESLQAWYLLGLYYQETEQTDLALDAYSQIRKIDSSFRNAPYNQGYIYLVYLNDFPSAINAFSEAIAIDSAYTDAYFNRGYAFELNGQLTEAFGDYKTTLQLDPEYFRAVERLNKLDQAGFRR